VRLVGYGCATHIGKKLQALPDEHKAFYPTGIRVGSTLTPQLDLAMSARCVAALLGGNPTDASLPAAVPPSLAKLVGRVALSDPTLPADNAWALREELGHIADNVFGAPQFIPIVLPS
jgi:hypothetical protein